MEEAIGKLNSPIFIKEVEFLDKTFPQRKLTAQMASLVILNKHLYANSIQTLVKD